MELFSLPPYAWLLLLLGALMVGVSKAGFGAGAGIMAVPLMAVAVGARDMLPVLLPVLICGDVFALMHYAGKGQLDRRNLAVLIPSSLVGVGIGMLILHWFLRVPQGEDILQRTIGGVCVVFAAMQAYNYMRRTYGAKKEFRYRPALWHGAGIGTVAGATSTLAHSAGPLIALFLLPQRLPRRVFVGTSVCYFFIGNVVKLIPYTAENLFTGRTVGTSLILFPCVIAGTVAGVQLNRRISDFFFNVTVYGITFATGIYLLL